MASAVAPIKVSADTDELISHAAHFMSVPKKTIVDEAVREYIANHRDEIHRGVQDAIAHLDGTTGSAVSALSGLTAAEIDDLGGLPS
jgi:predicted transcriptional regulator